MLVNIFSQDCLFLSCDHNFVTIFIYLCPQPSVMTFIETQRKGGKVYHYLTKTIRHGHSFRKIRVLLSDKELPEQTLKKIAALKIKALDKKQECPLSVQFSTYIDSAKISDKQVIWERPCHLFLVHIAAEVIVKPQKDVFGYSWGKSIGFFKNNMVKFVWDKKYMVNSGIHIINKFMDSSYFTDMKQRWEILTNKLIKQPNLNKNLRHLTNSELLSHYNLFYKIFYDWWAASQVAECVSFGAEYLLSNVVDDKTMSLITIPSEKSFSTIEEEKLMIIASHVQSNKKLSKLFTCPTNKILSKLNNFPHINKLLDEHTKKYYWIQNNYLATLYSGKEYFVARVKKLLDEKFIPEESLNIIDKKFKALVNERKKVINSLSLEPKYAKLIALVDYFTVFQDRRKAISIEGNYYLNEFLKELSRRTGISMDLLYFSTIYEFEPILNGTFDINELSKRKHGVVMVIEESGKLSLFTGKDYDCLYKQIFGLHDNLNITEFEGKRAEGGKVTGTAKVILDPRNAQHFSIGDILVTTMTSPEFLPLMKKALAIITDEGGITCHAAIVSRELGKPCVVGTKIATQVIKDGNIVDVNANHGLIRIRRE